VPEIGPKIHLTAAACGKYAAMVMTDGKRTYYTPVVTVGNTTAGKTGLWLFQIGDRQEYDNFELSRAKFAPAIPVPDKQAAPRGVDAKVVRLRTDEYRAPNVPSPQDWVLVLE